MMLGHAHRHGETDILNAFPIQLAHRLHAIKDMQMLQIRRS